MPAVGLSRRPNSTRMEANRSSGRDPPVPGGVLSPMRFVLLVGLVIATAACEGYHFPGPEGGTGTVHGHVLAFNCGGPIQPDAGACPAHAGPACPPALRQPADQTCGGPWPVADLRLTFTNGSHRRVAKTDSAGAYSIDLPAGTWDVSTVTRFVSGPETVAVIAGTSIVADYTVDNGMRAAA